MRQCSNFFGQSSPENSFFEQRFTATASLDQTARLTTMLDASKTQPQLETELSYERCLNRLGQRFNECIVTHLTALPQPQDGHSAETMIFQTLAQELSTVLPGEVVAIALADRAIVDISTICFASPTEPQFGCGHTLLLTPAMPIKLRVGEVLTDRQLQGLKAVAPESVWQIADGSPITNWLLTCPILPLDQPPTDPIGHPLKLQIKTQLIERSIEQCVTALQQIRLIQAQQQQQQELVARNQELVQTNQLKSEFLANTSHEIRTPLSSILGFTHLLREQGYSPTNLRHQEYLNIILSSGQHLLALINDILDLSKIEANQLDLQWERVEVRSVCQTALTLVKEKASDKGLQLRLEIHPQVDTLIVDALRLKQMLFNLLSNALKFTQQGSVGLDVLLTGEFLRFTVWDTGIGISQEQQRLLFRPYSQIANTVVGRDAGTGLGLALTQKLAELHGGWVEVHSEIDQGSRFTIALPLVPTPLLEGDDESIIGTFAPPDIETGTTLLPLRKRPSAVQQPRRSPDMAQSRSAANKIGEAKIGEDKAAAQSIACPKTPRSKKQPSTKPTKQIAKDSQNPPGTGSSKQSVPPLTPRSNHLLLVEDNLPNAKLLLTYLSKSGYEVTWVATGREMWQALRRSLPALILMDINLPEVDGLTLTQQLKADPRFRSIPVIAQTAMAMSGDRDLCLQAGAVDYVSKPIDLKALRQLVARYVEEVEG